MTSDFKVGKGVQKALKYWTYRVKIVGYDRQVKNGRETSDVIYGRSLTHLPILFDFGCFYKVYREKCLLQMIELYKLYYVNQPGQNIGPNVLEGRFLTLELKNLQSITKEKVSFFTCSVTLEVARDFGTRGHPLITLTRLGRQVVGGTEMSKVCRFSPI